MNHAVFQTEFLKKIKTYILCSINYFRKWCRLRDNVEKYCRAGQATDDYILRRMRFACSMAKARHTLRVCNAYCFCRRRYLSKRLSVLPCRYIACPVGEYIDELLINGRELHILVQSTNIKIFKALPQKSVAYW